MAGFRTALPLLIVCIYWATMGFSFTCKEVERQALLKFKHGFTIDESNQLGSWVGLNCCRWKGVGCDNITGHVVRLELRGDGRYSSSYLEATEVNPALAELQYLRYLDLSFINFNGCGFPEFFGSMRELQYLNLSSDSFQGKVARNLGNLTKLVVLDIGNLHDVDLLGEWWSQKMEVNSLEWVFKLENLQHLDLSGIDMGQTLDALNLLHKLPSLSVLNLDSCSLGNSPLLIRNSTVSSSTLQHLNLRYNYFSGPIPQFIQNLTSIRFLDLSFNYLNSSFPAWMGHKKKLEHLNVGNNSFSGSVPHFIQNMSSIRFLDLSSNQFSSSFPHPLQNLTSLTFLDLSYNQFSSSIPSWLANKKNLEYLSLSHNYFDRVEGGILNIISHLCSLKNLDLSYNHLVENVSESHVYNISRCIRYDLESLHMQNNNMTGQLPTTKSLLSLQELDLSHNNYEIVPASFGQLSSLENVDLSYNKLSVVNQASLANLYSLTSLDISSNSLILNISSDWLPPFQLSSLNILPCKLNSPFPKWLLSQTRLGELDLSDTGIFGPLPDNIGNAFPFGILRLANNHINGSIPRSLCKSLTFDLHNNMLSGRIPDCWTNSQIIDVVLSSNRLSGPIPNSLTKVATLNLLSLNNNLLEGEVPLFLSSSSKLTVLDLGRNHLHGEIIEWINGSNLPSLRVLILRENLFKGIIPLQLCSLHVLQIIDLAHNNLFGTIPQCFGNFKSMASDITSGVAPGPTMLLDDWRAVEVIKGVESEYTKILHQLVNIDLSCNNLVGVVPPNITRLSDLLGLNLSYNHLSGIIPKDIGKMKSLESLDFSWNNISGPIPESISSLNFLSNMNLSFNNLQGQIPIGRHLQTLSDPSIYMGNPGLCGDPLPKCLTGGIAHPPTGMALEDEGANKHEKMWLCMVIMLGFATGFWGVIGTLVVHKKWRFAYFRIGEELADWIYVRVAVRIAQANRGR